MRIAFVDTYYPEFLGTLKLGNGSYGEELDKVLSRNFGTSNFYSREFLKLGWEAIDIIANYHDLQFRWSMENQPSGFSQRVKQIALDQIKQFNPDIVFCQDLSCFGAETLADLSRKYLLAAQLSCESPGGPRLKCCHTVFTSFPHYVEMLRIRGVKHPAYMPLAFHESVLKPPVERDIDVSFVGGIGWQWKQGLEVLEAVAREIPTFQWWGYGVEQLNADSPLRRCYKGTAWGDEMYAIYQRSKIVINRHGEIAENYANNMRMYEATGCGAILVTEQRDNMLELFQGDEYIPYSNPSKAVSGIKMFLEEWPASEIIGKLGQKRTLARHTYAHRVPKIAEVLMNAMQAA